MLDGQALDSFTSIAALSAFTRRILPRGLPPCPAAGQRCHDVTSTVFAVMRARASAASYGFDRFWRNVRTHTLHNPAEYRIRSVGIWFLTGALPQPSNFQ